MRTSLIVLGIIFIIFLGLIPSIFPGNPVVIFAGELMSTVGAVISFLQLFYTMPIFPSRQKVTLKALAKEPQAHFPNEKFPQSVQPFVVETITQPSSTVVENNRPINQFSDFPYGIWYEGQA